VRTLQEWKQGRRAPSGAARTLLRKKSADTEVGRDLVGWWWRAAVGLQGANHQPSLLHRDFVTLPKLEASGFEP
jgi:hypothetical protein